MARQPLTLFGLRLREARLRAKIPQDKLGVLIGIDELSSSARISRYESGVHAPSFEIAEKLAEALNIPAAYFYCRDEKLAELILSFSKLDTEKVKKVIEAIRANQSSPN